MLEPLPGTYAHEQLSMRGTHQVPELNYRSSAVLTLLYPMAGNWSIALMKRTEDGRAHSGQISFPGGKTERHDRNHADTALREAHEELGIVPSHVTILGQLTQLYIPSSRYVVYPMVGVTAERPLFVPSPYEVARIIEVPLDVLLSPASRGWATVTTSTGISLEVPAFLVEGQIVWGATAMILNELLVVIKELDWA